MTEQQLIIRRSILLATLVILAACAVWLCELLPIRNTAGWLVDPLLIALFVAFVLILFWPRHTTTPIRQLIRLFLAAIATQVLVFGALSNWVTSIDVIRPAYGYLPSSSTFEISFFKGQMRFYYIFCDNTANHNSRKLEIPGVEITLFYALLLSTNSPLPPNYSTFICGADLHFIIPFILFAAYPAITFARNTYRSHTLRQRTKQGHCLHCNYNLRGNTSNTCPECGKPINLGSERI